MVIKNNINTFIDYSCNFQMLHFSKVFLKYHYNICYNNLTLFVYKIMFLPVLNTKNCNYCGLEY